MFRGAGDRPLEPKALRMCRGLLGALQCPRWGAVCLCCKVKLHIPRLRQLMAPTKLLAPTDDLVFVCFSDAAWAARHDSEIVACHTRVLNGEESEFVVVDWKSFSLAQSVAQKLAL